MSDVAEALFDSLEDSFFDERHPRDEVRPVFLAAHAATPERVGSITEVRTVWTAGGQARQTVRVDFGPPTFVIPEGHAIDAAWQLPAVAETVIAGGGLDTVTQPEAVAARRAADEHVLKVRGAARAAGIEAAGRKIG